MQKKYYQKLVGTTLRDINVGSVREILIYINWRAWHIADKMCINIFLPRGWVFGRFGLWLHFVHDIFEEIFVLASLQISHAFVSFLYFFFAAKNKNWHSKYYTNQFLVDFRILPRKWSVRWIYHWRCPFGEASANVTLHHLGALGRPNEPKTRKKCYKFIASIPHFA